MINIYELLRRDQDGTSSYVRDVLDKLGVTYHVDSYGNIYYLDYENAPLLSAHMDTVRKDADFCIGAFLTENDNDKIFSGGILGGDDKCGVYIILKAIEAGKKINFIFSRDEEIGCLGIKALLKPNYVENKELADKVRKCLYCLVLDRRGNSDIICDQNDYGTKEFEKALEKISDDFKFGYKGARGLCSDADTIRDFVSTANLSTGYFSPHSQKEYILKKDLERACDYTFAIIDNLKEHFNPKEKTYSYNYYNCNNSKTNKSYNGSCRGYYGGSYDYYGYDYGSNYYWDDWEEDDIINGFQNKSNNVKEKECSFCHSHASSDPIVDIVLPDRREVHVCEYCLEDLELEIKDARQKMDALNINKI